MTTIAMLRREPRNTVMQVWGSDISEDAPLTELGRQSRETDWKTPFDVLNDERSVVLCILTESALDAGDGALIYYRLADL